MFLFHDFSLDYGQYVYTPLLFLYNTYIVLLEKEPL